MSNNEPIFKEIFGKYWNSLPPVMQKHYANRGYTNDEVVCKGVMNVELSPIAKLLSPLLALTKTLLPRSGENIPATVRFLSSPDNDYFHFDRELCFPDGKRYQFFSHMVSIGNGDIIEWTGSGIGWKGHYSYDGEHVRLDHRGYCYRILGKQIPLPSWLFGYANDIEEATIDENRFRMHMTINHPVFGKLYSYSGTFDIAEVNYRD